MISLPLEMAALLGVMAAAWLAAALAAKTKFYRNLPELAAHGRFATLDGLRGFLALTVFVHHAEVHRNFIFSGVWFAPTAGVFRNAGPIPVQLFFMITGFLFWGQAIARGAKVDWRDLAISRIARIAPLYVVAISITLGLAVLSVRGEFELSPQELSETVIRVLTFGAMKVGYLGEIDLMPFHAGVTWTLVYEWGFYIALPFLAWFATSQRFPLVALAMLATLGLNDTFPVEQCFFFMLGMAAAQLKETHAEFPPAAHRVSSVVVAGLLTVALVQRGLDSLFVGAAMLFPAFLLLVYGNPLFGVLRTPAAKVLGACSYSTYLLHGIFLYLLLQWGLGPARVRSMPPFLYWLAIFGGVTLLVALCAVSFRWIEHPSIRAGKRARKGLRAASASAQGAS